MSLWTPHTTLTKCFTSSPPVIQRSTPRPPDLKTVSSPRLLLWWTANSHRVAGWEERIKVKKKKNTGHYRRHTGRLLYCLTSVCTREASKSKAGLFCSMIKCLQDSSTFPIHLFLSLKPEFLCSPLLFDTPAFASQLLICREAAWSIWSKPNDPAVSTWAASPSLMIIVELICKHLHILLEMKFDCRKTKLLKKLTIFVVKIDMFPR